MTLFSRWPGWRARLALADQLARILTEMGRVRMDVQGLSDKLDKLQGDVTTAIGEIQTAASALKAELATALGAQGTVDLQPLADKIDAIDKAVNAAAANLVPAPAPTT